MGAILTYDWLGIKSDAADVFVVDKETYEKWTGKEEDEESDED